MIRYTVQWNGGACEHKHRSLRAAALCLRSRLKCPGATVARLGGEELSADEEASLQVSFDMGALD